MFDEFIEYAKTHTLDEIRSEWGGMNIYIPSKKDNTELVEEYKRKKNDMAHNKLIYELSRKYDLSTSRVYELTKDYRPKVVQKSLF